MDSANNAELWQSLWAYLNYLGPSLSAAGGAALAWMGVYRFIISLDDHERIKQFVKSHPFLPGAAVSIAVALITYVAKFGVPIVLFRMLASVTGRSDIDAIALTLLLVVVFRRFLVKILLSFERERKALLDPIMVKKWSPNESSIIVKDELKGKGVQLIAWSGYDEPEVKSLFIEKQKTKLDVLEYVRGVEKVTHLKYEGSLFDVLIADVEFLRRHYIGNTLVELKGPNYEPLWNKISPSLRMGVEREASQLGIPIRFGLNDIVINWKAATSILETHEIKSYTDLRLSTVLPKCRENCRIGLWNWSVTTLPVLLLTEGITLPNVWEQPEDKIKQIRDCIINNKDKFFLFNSPEDATRHLVNGGVWTVLGAGGWMLPLEVEGRKNLQAVLPSEGAIMWVECAAIINNKEEEDKTLSRNLIDCLLETNTQELLTRRKAYRACPASHEALTQLSEELKEIFHIEKIFDRNWSFENNIFLRKLPKNFSVWEQYWGEIENNVQHI